MRIFIVIDISNLFKVLINPLFCFS